MLRCDVSDQGAGPGSRLSIDTSDRIPLEQQEPLDAHVYLQELTSR